MALGISEAVSLSGRVVELVKAGATIELQERILELREAVLNAKDEILRLREEVSELRRTAAERKELRFDIDEGVYWRDVSEKEMEGPFCQRCCDSDSKLIRLQSAPPRAGYSWKCTVCGKAF